MSEAGHGQEAGAREQPLPGIAPDQARAPAPSASLAARGWEWLWRAKGLRAARARASSPALGYEELVRRAKLAAEAAQRLHEPVPPLEAGSGAALALELYRQSIYWALAAETGSDLERGGAAGVPSAVRERLAGLPEARLTEISETPTSLAQLAQVLWEADFRQLAALPVQERAELAGRAKRLSDALLASATEPARALERLWFERVLRSGGVLLVGIALAMLASNLRLRQRTDLAGGRPWQASSVGFDGCTSPAQDCGKGFFFHTQTEQSPWVRLDLGAVRTFSAVELQNRRDCCAERATPLLVEVSDDGTTFREVARRDQVFQTWTAELGSVSARYVRVRALHRTTLHLSRVSVLH